MKIVQAHLYEKGDYVQVLTGYNRGRIGEVLRHSSLDDEVLYKLVDKDYDVDDYFDDDDYEESASKYLKYLSKTDYATYLKNNKILLVPGLPVSIQYKKNNFLIGDNVVTPANAKKIAEFITQNTAPKKVKKKKA